MATLATLAARGYVIILEVVVGCLVNCIERPAVRGDRGSLKGGVQVTIKHISLRTVEDSLSLSIFRFWFCKQFGHNKYLLGRGPKHWKYNLQMCCEQPELCCAGVDAASVASQIQIPEVTPR